AVKHVFACQKQRPQCDALGNRIDSDEGGHREARDARGPDRRRLLDDSFGSATNPLLVTGFGLYFVGALVRLLVLARVDVSIAYPSLSLGFILTAGHAWLMLGANIGPMRLIGILLWRSAYIIAIFQV